MGALDQGEGVRVGGRRRAAGPEVGKYLWLNFKRLYLGTG